MKINIVITDDHPIVTQGLQHFLAQDKDINILETFAEGEELMNWLESNSTDLILLDIFLKDGNGLDYCKMISKKFPEIGIIGISGQDESIIISQMLQNGALGYVLKNAESHEILEAIYEVNKGNKYLCQRTQEALKKLDQNLQEIPKITRREKEILKLIAEGLTTMEIAEKLFISSHTVESHRKNLMEKFQVKSTASVINKVKNLGLI